MQPDRTAPFPHEGGSPFSREILRFIRRNLSARLAWTMGRMAIALVVIAGLTAIESQVLQVNGATAAFTYLLAILALATWWGLAESITASLAGMLCYNFFFLPPIGTFVVADPQNWVALFVFLVTAITASHLSHSAHQRAEEALTRQREMERLYEISRALMLLDSEQPLAGQIAGWVLRTFGLREAAFFDRLTGQVHWAGTEAALLPEKILREVAGSGGTLKDQASDCLIVPVYLGGQQMGSVGICGGSVSEPALHAIANLSAIVLERGRTQEMAGRAEAARQNDQLKSTLLDALAHEFKTPLTSIKAAITSALSYYPHSPQEEDLLSVVEEEANRMNAMVTESIEVARIEAGHLRLNPQPFRMGDLIALTLERLRSFLDERQVDVDVAADVPAVYADPHLSGLVLRQLLHNAVKYSSPNSPIAISAHLERDFVVMTIGNEGVGIPEHEHAAIFERFYRGRATQNRIPGTGLGLTIAREIIQAHGGSIWVESQPDQGARFLFSLPVAKEQPDDER